MPNDSPRSGERLISVIDEHWIKYLLPSFVYVILLFVSVLLFYLAGLSAHHEMWLSHMSLIGGLILMLTVHHWFFLKLFSEAIDCVVITNLRSIQFKTRLFFLNEIRENSFDKMRTVEASMSGLLQNLLRFGTLRFQGGADIPLMPHPHSIAKDIEQAMGRR